MATSESDGEIFEIEKLLERRKRGRTVEYKVRWRGFGEEEDSWETERNLNKHASSVVAEFVKQLEKQPTKTPSTKRQKSAVTGKSTARSTTKSRVRVETVTVESVPVERQVDSSPESSPVTRRRTLRSETRTERSPRAWTGPAAPSAAWWRRENLPLITLTVCYVIIGLTFVIPWLLNRKQ